MELNYNPFWFYVLVGIGAIFISLAILFGLQIAYSQVVDDYKSCIKIGLPPVICNVMFPPLNQQNV